MCERESEMEAKACKSESRQRGVNDKVRAKERERLLIFELERVNV